MVKNMKEAVNLSWSLAEPGDTIPRSPACASWDMYEKFEDRGDDFKRCVAELSNHPGTVLPGYFRAATEYVIVR